MNEAGAEGSFASSTVNQTQHEPHQNINEVFATARPGPAVSVEGGLLGMGKYLGQQILMAVKLS